MPAKGTTLDAAKAWRKTVLAAKARLKPVIIELEAMLIEARAEWAELERAKRETDHLEPRTVQPFKPRR